MAVSYTPAAIHAALEADRWTASQAGREQPELDVVSVLLVVRQKLAEGRDAEARAIVAEYRAQKGK